MSQLETLNTFERVRTELFHRRLTWGWLAREIGISEGYLRMITKGERKAEHQKPRIAKALGLTVEDLWPDSGDGKAA